MTDKEQIMNDGEKNNKCNGCKLWNGYMCTGDRSYEPNAEAHRAICNEHIAKEFWKVYHELFYKTQECEKIKEKYEALRLENQEGYEIVAELKQECEELKKRATIAEDNFACEVQARLYHQNEWLKFSKECEELKKQLETSEEWRINAESLNEKLDIKNTRYRKALEEIEEYVRDNSDFDKSDTLTSKTGAYDILDIISKAKDGE